MPGKNLLRYACGGLLCLAALAVGAENLQEPAESPLLKRSEVLEIEESDSIIDGMASFYSRRMHGRLVATGEIFRNELLTAASNFFPLGRWLAVRRPGGPCVTVRVNDRMHSRHQSRIVDLSYAAAQRLGMIAKGVVAVEAALLPHNFDRRKDPCAQAFGQ